MAVERVVIEITGDTSKIKSTIAELEKLGKVDRNNSDSFKRNNKEYNDQLNKTKGNISSFGDQMNSLKQQIIGAFAISSLIAFGKEAVQTSAKIESIGNSLKFITGSSANAEKTMQYLTGLSERLGLEFESTAQAFKLFAGAATQSGMSLSQSKTIFEQVSKAVTTMGLSADDAQGVFLAMSQILSKGTVSAEELRGQIGERIPGAFAIAAKSIGVTERQLNKMLEQGQVLSKDFLPKFASQLEKDLGGGAEAAANSTQAALNRMKNSYDEFLLYVGQKLTPAVLALTKITI
jgi:tape measure domain-containing protein